jgi:hypothetical protein
LLNSAESSDKGATVEKYFKLRRISMSRIVNGDANRKRLFALFALLLGLSLATAMTAWAQPQLSDSQEPGSVLVFPLFETGAAMGGSVSTFQISVACPTGASCTDGQDVDIRAHWVCPGSGFFNVCQDRDFVLDTTVNGTVTFSPPALPCPRGYLIAWVVNESAPGVNIKFDGLTGNAVIRESSTAVTSYNAIPIQAVSGLATGATVPGSPALNFNGTTAYKAVTGVIIGNAKYDSASNQTSLVLLTLDVHANRANSQTFADLVSFDRFESPLSSATSFTCWGESFLSDLGLNNGDYGLITSSPAVSPSGTPVTLLGLVITREPSAATTLRHYAYPLLNDSSAVATTFVP